MTVYNKHCKITSFWTKHIPSMGKEMVITGAMMIWKMNALPIYVDILIINIKILLISLRNCKDPKQNNSYHRVKEINPIPIRTIERIPE